MVHGYGHRYHPGEGGLGRAEAAHFTLKVFRRVQAREVSSLLKETFPRDIA